MILIDGGKGQLSAAVEVLNNVQETLPIIGLAKQNEEIFRPGVALPVLLPRRSSALHLIQRIRDEAHRFAITYHRSLRGKTMKMSILNQIPGIGPARRKALIQHFGSVERIKSATLGELAATPTITKAAAEAIYVFFQNLE